MKMTIEMPESMMREARLKAAELGISVDQFVSEAMEEKIARQFQQAEAEVR
jgi:predicted HicB family RNase H-like nuclease